VHQVFEDNDTAYMAMDYIRGHDLLEIVDEKKAVLTPDQIVTIAGKLVSAHVPISMTAGCCIATSRPTTSSSPRTANRS
jgi:serine/threonine protein kinase